MPELLVPREAELQVAIKEESTSGVDVFGDTYVAADVLPVVTSSINWSMDPNETRNEMTAGLEGAAPSTLGRRVVTLSCSMYCRGAGVAYDDTPVVVPETDRVFQLTGHGRTIDATPGTESVTYKMVSAGNRKTYTAYLIAKIPGGSTALSWQMVGCMGSLRGGGVAGDRWRWDFTLRGQLEERKDITYVPGTLSLTPGWIRTEQAAFQIGSTNYAPRIANIAFDQRGQIGVVDSINAVAGIAGVTLQNRDPRLTIDPEVDLEANSAWWVALRDGAPLKDCTFGFGPAQYNRFKFRFGVAAAAQAQVVSQGFSIRNGIPSLPTEILATISAANNDYEIVYD